MPTKKKEEKNEALSGEALSVDQTGEKESQALSLKSLNERIEYLEGFIERFSEMTLHVINNTGNNAIARNYGFEPYSHDGKSKSKF